MATPFLDVLRTYDVQIRMATAEDGTSTLVLDVPQRVETRALIEAIRGYPETELIAKRGDDDHAVGATARYPPRGTTHRQAVRSVAGGSLQRVLRVATREHRRRPR